MSALGPPERVVRSSSLPFPSLPLFQPVQPTQNARIRSVTAIWQGCSSYPHNCACKPPNHSSIFLNFSAYCITHCDSSKQNRYVKQVKTPRVECIIKNGLNLYTYSALNNSLSQAFLKGRFIIAAENIVTVTLTHKITVTSPGATVHSTSTLILRSSVSISLPIHTTSPPGSPSVSSITPAPMSSEPHPCYTADHMPLEIRVPIGIVATAGIGAVLGIFVPLIYAVIVGCLNKGRARKVAN